MDRSDLPIIGIFLGVGAASVGGIIGIVYLIVTVAKWAWEE